MLDIHRAKIKESRPGRLLFSVCVTMMFFCPAVCAAAGTGTAAQWREGEFTIGTVAPQKAWAGKAIDPAQWRAAAQADIAGLLAKAPRLECEAAAPPPQRCWSGHQPYLVPNPDGKSWDMLLPYYNKYRGEQEIIIHDFGTAKTSRQVLSTGKGDSVLRREAIGFHMQPSYYTNNQLVFCVYGPVLFAVYDPAADKFTYGVKPFGDAVINGRAVLGDDGLVYGVGWPKDKSGFIAFSFNPLTKEVAKSETFGPANPHRQELYREVRMCGDWIYAAIGNRPWHLVAYNFASGEDRLLARTKDIRGSSDTIGMKHIPGGFRGHIREPAAIEGIEKFDEKQFDFWLHDGRIIRRDSDKPPWTAAANAARPPKSFRWAREYQVWPGDFEPPSPPPQFKRDAGGPDCKGRVELPYRLGGENQWRKLTYEVKMYPGVVQLLTEVNDRVLFATDSGYGQHVFYDTGTNKLMRISGTLSPYSIGHYNNRLYVSGYPTSQMFEYDFSRKIGLKQDDPNPRRVAWVGKFDDTHCPLGGTVGCADGRVYNAGTTYGRRREGGGFGWYDTRTGETGGMPFEGHRIFWMTAAAAGRYLLMSSKCGGDGVLFCWDTQKRDFLYKKPVLAQPTPGAIEEALPGGLVIGHTTGGEEAAGLLYGLCAETGEILWRKEVPVKPVTAFSSVRRHSYAFRRGPDGFIWSFFDNTLVRIDPRNAEIEPVGKVSGKPVQIAFANGGVYVAGGDRLRRIRGLSARARNEAPK
jgi:hypothetical protein